jgi:hypothetical protein
MAEKTYIVRFKPPEQNVQPVQAAYGEVVDDYLVFFRDDGSVAAFFLYEVVDGWSAEESSK